MAQDVLWGIGGMVAMISLLFASRAPRRLLGAAALVAFAVAVAGCGTSATKMERPNAPSTATGPVGVLPDGQS